MRPPTEQMRERFDALSPEQRLRALELMENGRAVLDALGATRSIMLEAWAAVLEAVEAQEGDLR